MSDEILRYTDLAALIQVAKARGWSTDRIVREHFFWGYRIPRQ
jgi:hypothetical protein